MTTPSFSVLKQVDDLLKQVDSLNSQIEHLEAEIEAIKKQNSQELQDLETKELNKQKQHLELEQIDQDLAEVREKETHLRQMLLGVIDKAIQQAFESGKLTQFFDTLLESLDSNKEKYTLKAGKLAAKQLPKTKLEIGHLDNPEAIEIDLDYKAFYFDLKDLKADLRLKILKEKLPEFVKSNL